MMDLAKLQQKLIATARANPPGSQVPYAFEKRVMARLPARAAFDLGTLWARALWRGALVCLALMVLLSLVSFILPPGKSPSNDLTQDFEKTMLAAVNQDGDSAW